MRDHHINTAELAAEALSLGSFNGDLKNPKLTQTDATKERVQNA